MITPTMRRTLRTAVTLALVLGVATCDDDATAPSQVTQTYAAAKARWESTRPQSYTFVATRSCFCLPDAIGPVRVTVQANAVTRVVRVDDGRDVSTDLWFTVEELFTLIEQQLRDLPDRLTVTYDGTWGFPGHIVYGMPEVDYGGTISVQQFSVQ